MRTPPDLDPADADAREHLRDTLTGMRVDAGLSQRDLALWMGLHPSAVSLLESRTTWRISTVQRWAHALGHRLVLWPDGLPYVDVSMFRPQGDEMRAMEWDRRALIEAMADARRELGITQRELAARLGVTEPAIGLAERESDVLMISAQRYCRGLGGSLGIDVVSLPPVLDDRHQRLVDLASELVRRVREVDADRNAAWLRELSDQDRWELLFALAAMVPASEDPGVLLAWTHALAGEVREAA